MFAPAERRVRRVRRVANRQLDRVLLSTATQSGLWYALHRARGALPCVSRGTAVSSRIVVVAMETGMVVVRHRLGLDDGAGQVKRERAAAASLAS